MKKLFLAAGIIAAAMIFETVNAQRTSVGVKGGVSFTGVSNLKGKDRTTGHAGLFLQARINKNWVFQPEVLYSAQGQHFTNDLGQGRVLALDYIQVPLMLQYHPVQRFYFEAGPQAGVKINSETKDAGSGNDKNNVDENYKKADIGINAGLGVNITNHIGIYGRYTQGLMDVAKSGDIYRTNHGVQVGAAIKF